MAYDVMGKLKSIGGIQSFASGFTKREIVLETEGKFPQLVRLVLMKEKTELTQNLKEGDGVTVSFDLRGNEHKGRVYTDLVAWRIKPHVHQDLTAAASAAGQPAAPKSVTAKELDEIPF